MSESSMWRAQVDLRSLSEPQLVALLKQRGVNIPPTYEHEDLVVLAQNTKFMEQRPAKDPSGENSGQTHRPKTG